MNKKKLFISCPMKGRTEENIKKSMAKMHKIAETVFEQELDVIDTYIEDEPPVGIKPGIWYLGKSIEMMAEADYFIGVLSAGRFGSGCSIETDVARSYGIPIFTLSIRNVLPLEEYHEMYDI